MTPTQGTRGIETGRAERLMRLGFGQPTPRESRPNLVVVPRSISRITTSETVPVNLLGFGSWKTMVKLVSLKTGVPMSKILGDSRFRADVLARHHAMWLVASHTGWSYPVVGQKFGKDHSTVIHALQAHCARTGVSYPFGDEREVIDQRRAIRNVEIIRLFRRGMKPAAIAKRVGITSRGVNYVVRLERIPAA